VVGVDEGVMVCECMVLDIGHMHAQENGIRFFVLIMRGERASVRSGERSRCWQATPKPTPGGRSCLTYPSVALRADSCGR
jgi:hypothetical protein